MLSSKNDEPNSYRAACTGLWPPNVLKREFKCVPYYIDIENEKQIKI